MFINDDIIKKLNQNNEYIPEFRFYKWKIKKKFLKITLLYNI